MPQPGALDAPLPAARFGHELRLAGVEDAAATELVEAGRRAVFDLIRAAWLERSATSMPEPADCLASERPTIRLRVVLESSAEVVIAKDARVIGDLAVAEHQCLATWFAGEASASHAPGDPPLPDATIAVEVELPARLAPYLRDDPTL